MKKIIGLLGLALVLVLATTPSIASAEVDNTKPTKVTNLALGSVANNQVTLTWSAASDNVAVSSYDVFRDGRWFGWSTTTTWTDESPTPGATHSYRINTLDRAGNWSGQSVALTVTVPGGNGPDRSKPSQITRLDYADVAPSSVSLSWPPASDNVGVRSYDVFRDGRWVGWSTSTSWTDEQPTPGETHTYQINVLDAAGNWSGRGRVKALVEVPARDNERGEVKVLAAGDVARCDRTADNRVGELIDGLEGTVLALGDLAYPDGTAWEYANCYDPAYGSFKDRTIATPGNHEYVTPGAQPYFDYFGVDGAGPDGDGYYSRDLGSWHIVSLNSECWNVGGCGANDPMARWLKEDLAASDAKCTLAFWHRPYLSSERDKDGLYLEELMEILVDNDVELLLTGHAHSYERFSRMDAAGRWKEDGIRQFVIGTGGTDLRVPGPAEPLQARAQHTEHGVVEFTLADSSYSWRWIGLPGGSFGDEGATACSG